MNTMTMSLVFLLCSVALLSAADTRRFARAADFRDDGGMPAEIPPGYVDADLLSQLLSSARSKRQWCQRGKTFNHVTGRCMFSFAAMRARGRM